MSYYISNTYDETDSSNYYCRRREDGLGQFYYRLVIAYGVCDEMRKIKLVFSKNRRRKKSHKL
jgi:hypothetical protein